MRFSLNALRLASAAAVVTSLLFAGAGPALAATGTGWVRLAHFSPNTPAVDVYLYSFGTPRARLVLHHVSYGMASPYEELPAGDYTVAMRLAGAAPSSKAVLSTAFTVSAGDAYTVAGMGPASGLRLQVLDDTLTVPQGRALVRVIQASLQQHQVTVTLGAVALARKLPFAGTTSYQSVPSGTATVRVTGTSESASQAVSLPADTTHTIVVLDGSGSLRIMALEDAAGSTTMPSGGAATGLGGTAPRPAPSRLPWLVLAGAGLVLTGAGGVRYRRARPAGPRHS